MHLFHKWKYINKEIHDTFYGRPVVDLHPKFRQCVICKKTQQFKKGYLNSGIWITLDSQRVKIFNDVFREQLEEKKEIKNENNKNKTK